MSWWSSRAVTTEARGTRSTRRSTGGILVALALTGASVAVPQQGAGRGSSPPPDPPQGLDRRVYDTLTPDPSSLDELVRVTGIDLAELCGSLERLAQAGLA